MQSKDECAVKQRLVRLRISSYSTSFLTLSLGIALLGMTIYLNDQAHVSRMVFTYLDSIIAILLSIYLIVTTYNQNYCAQITYITCAIIYALSGTFFMLYLVLSRSYLSEKGQGPKPISDPHSKTWYHIDGSLPYISFSLSGIFLASVAVQIFINKTRSEYEVIQHNNELLLEQANCPSNVDSETGQSFICTSQIVTQVTRTVGDKRTHKRDKHDSYYQLEQDRKIAKGNTNWAIKEQSEQEDDRSQNKSPADDRCAPPHNERARRGSADLEDDAEHAGYSVPEQQITADNTVPKRKELRASLITSKEYGDESLD